MRFGLFGGARALRGGPYGDSDGYADYIAYVREAEALGFDSVFLVEHHFTGHGQVSASLSLLSYLAACTTRIRLGTAVVVLPWHNPVLVAEQAGTLDLLSGGRFDFGVGNRARDAWPRFVQQPGDSLSEEATAPFADGRSRHALTASDDRVGLALGRAQDDPRAQGDRLRRGPTTRPLLEGRLFVSGQHEWRQRSAQSHRRVLLVAEYDGPTKVVSRISDSGH